MREDKLEVLVELLDEKGNCERLIAKAATVPIARGAYNAAVTEYGAHYRVMMRHRARVIEQRDKAQH